MKKLEMNCVHTLNPHAKILFSGHMGSGKTTEVCRLVQTLSNSHEIIRFSVIEDLDGDNLTYVDLIFEIMTVVLLHFRDNDNVKKKINPNAFNKLYTYWHAEHFKTEVNDEISERNAEINSNFNTSASVNTFPNLVAKIKFLVNVGIKGQGIFKVYSETKESFKAKIEPRMSDLIAGINEMLSCINNAITPKKLLIVIEDLDKVRSDIVEELFVRHLTQIFSIEVKTIYMLPIYFEYSMAFKRVKDSADANYILNTISVLDENKQLVERNVQFLKCFVFKRADASFFEDEALELVIKKCGGILRDLFSLLVDASLNAIIEHPDYTKITLDDVDKACVKLRTEYVRAIESDEFYNRLLDIYREPENVYEDAMTMKLLRANLVIECGVTQYRLVHPLIIDYMRKKGDVH